HRPGRPGSDPGTGWRSIRFTHPLFAAGQASVGSVCASSFLCKVPGWDLVHLAHVRVALVLLVFFCIAFPSALFNSTLEANYDDVVGWFAKSDPWRKARHASRRLQGGFKIAVFVVLAAAACVFGDKSMHGSAALPGFLGLSV